MKSRIDEAVNMFESGYACAQSVFTTYADLFGIGRETALKLSGPLSAGVGRMREVCGTVSAMAMLSGLKKGFTDPEDLAGKEESYALVRRMSDALKSQHGTILCRELLGLPEGVEREESAKPQERTPEYYASRPCSGIVRTAARIVETQLLAELFSGSEEA
ncbi:MAG TPA: C-GCAxxG-C-C family protein [Candidatus Eisenbergiella merdavium]|uniref:C-GCAxxG-C-C family protein n=1 Tax=Candidatus Eisenbergiella merdavium TaxID=2838551 RepID=A0A9D2NG52_9FIRM|nr:C-GCAxxG-C-C family protein [Candidatus Eisenbergiella merdavium]